MAANSIERFVEKIFGYNLEKLDRHFVATQDRQVWYRVKRATKTMFTPDMKVLRVNPLELERFIGAVETFCKFDLEDPRFRWDNLKLSYYYGEDVAEGLRILNERCNNDLLVAADIETHHAGWNDNKLLSTGFAVSDDEAIALADIPQHLYAELEEFLNREDVRFCWHNGKFDCGKLWYVEKIRARVDEDSLLKHYVQVSETKGSHGLKDLGPIYLQAPQWDSELQKIKKEYCKKHKKLLGDFTYDLIPAEIRDLYMLHDCIASRRLITVFDEIKEPGTDEIYRKLIRASNVFTQLELAGMRADKEHLTILDTEFTEQIEEANKIIGKATAIMWNPVQYVRDTGAKAMPTKFNMNSPKQLKWLLTQAIGYEPESTDADTMDKLERQVELGELKVSDVAKELFRGIMLLRKATKYRDTYVSGMRSATCTDGRVRGSYKLFGTETGRLSSSEPKNIGR